VSFSAIRLTTTAKRCEIDSAAPPHASGGDGEEHINVVVSRRTLIRIRVCVCVSCLALRFGGLFLLPQAHKSWKKLQRSRAGELNEENASARLASPTQTNLKTNLKNQLQNENQPQKPTSKLVKSFFNSRGSKPSFDSVSS
jgi:hypothetical protein